MIDAPTFFAGAVILVTLGFVASLMLAYRASLVDPLQTLRDESSLFGAPILVLESKGFSTLAHLCGKS